MMTPPRQIVILDAPSNLGLRPPAPGRVPGVYRLASTLRAHGIIARLQAQDGGQVPAPPYAPDPDPATHFRNGPAIGAYSLQLADRIAAIRQAGHFPLVLGGDCSILLGAMIGLKRLGRYGLVFLDGHIDFAYPTPAPALAAAGLDLALATGHGPLALTDLAGQRPYVRETDVAVLAYRNEEYPPEYDLQPFWDSAMHRADVDEVQRVGVQQAATSALTTLTARGLDGFWIHLDADVLDPAIMPAVDSPDPPGGLSYAELTALLATLLRSPLAVGLEVTVFDPDLDPDGTLAEALTTMIVAAFQASSAI
jgi:arginase